MVIAEFLEAEQLIDMKDGIEKYESFVNSYNYEREHMEEGGNKRNDTSEEKFKKYLKQPIKCTKTGQKSVNNVGTLLCQPRLEVQRLIITWR